MQMSDGWKQLEIELRKILEAFRDQGVSKEMLNRPVEHASIIGGYNAIKSILDLIEAAKSSGKKATERLEEIESQDKEERELAHSVQRI